MNRRNDPIILNEQIEYFYLLILWPTVFPVESMATVLGEKNVQAIGCVYK